ncbi:hypothetical protein [Streptomyces sp. Ncost-T10-10d]|uniref:hypothetical protein n=1 Tax=Streptomyces sp. Ncost-T10-10d TaxID=1839774 RepID=UPI00210880DB|nr:hypothetical protein [Streptomyces sp. Ncost-T10-10d]
MAVLCVVIAALALAWTGRFGSLPAAVVLFPVTLAVGLPVLWGVSVLLTAAYILPTVALGHWFGRLAGHGRRWWWVAAGTALGLLPAAGLPTMARMLHVGFRDWRQLAMDGLLFAGALWAASTPASIAVHLTVLREDAGRPVRPVGHILLRGDPGVVDRTHRVWLYRAVVTSLIDGFGRRPEPRLGDVDEFGRHGGSCQGSIGMLLVKGAGHAADVEGRAVSGVTIATACRYGSLSAGTA